VAKAEVLHDIGKSFSLLGELGRAREVWSLAAQEARWGEVEVGVQQSLDCSSVLRDIAESLTEQGDFRAALDLSEHIKNPGKRQSAISEVERSSKNLADSSSK
jgi:hypothetical protein